MRQKQKFGRHSKPPNYRVGQRVFVYMPAAKQGKAHKFAHPFHGPYRIMEVCETGASVCPVDDQGRDSIRVAFDHLWPCSEGMHYGHLNVFAPIRRCPPPPEQSCEEEDTSVWSGRIHHHTVEDACTKSGDL